MKTASWFGVRRKFAEFVGLTRKLQVWANWVRVIIAVHEIIARVVGRVDVDHFDLPVVVLLQDLEDFEVVTLDEHVLGGVPIYRVLFVGHQGCRRRCLRRSDGLCLSGPGQTEPLTGVINIDSEDDFELTDVNFPVGHDLWEQ